MVLEKIGYVLDQDTPTLPSHPSADQSSAQNKWMDDDDQMKYYILALMIHELQSQHEYLPTIGSWLLIYKNYIVSKATLYILKCLRDSSTPKYMKDSQSTIW